MDLSDLESINNNSLFHVISFMSSLSLSHFLILSFSLPLFLTLTSLSPARHGLTLTPLSTDNGHQLFSSSLIFGIFFHLSLSSLQHSLSLSLLFFLSLSHSLSLLFFLSLTLSLLFFLSLSLSLSTFLSLSLSLYFSSSLSLLFFPTPSHFLSSMC